MPSHTYVKRLEIPITMNKPNDPNQPFDDDIAELFDGQEIDVPAALNDRIRNMAKAELEQNTAAGVNKPQTSRFAPLFATAAVMVLAVALVPMLVNQSKSPLESPTAAIEPMAAAPEASMKSAAESVSAELQTNAPADMSIGQARELKRKLKATPREQGGSAGVLEEITADSVASDQKKLAAPAAISNEFADAAVTIRAPSAVSTLQAPSSPITDSLSAQISADTVEAESEGESDYRLSQDDWLAEINRLFESDKQAIFLYELTLFKTQYPKVDLSKHLPADALKLDSSVGEQ